MDDGSSAARWPQQCIGPADKRTQSAASVGTPPRRPAIPLRAPGAVVPWEPWPSCRVSVSPSCSGSRSWRRDVIVAVALQLVGRAGARSGRLDRRRGAAVGPAAGRAAAGRRGHGGRPPGRAAGARREGSEPRRRADGDRAPSSSSAATAPAATAAFTAARKLGDPAADVALIVAGYNPKTPDATVSRLELLARDLAVRPLRAGRGAAVGGPAGAGDDGAEGRPRRRSGVVLRRQGRRPAASHHAAGLPPVRARRPAARRCHRRVAAGRGRRRARRRQGAAAVGFLAAERRATARRRSPSTARR